MFPSPGILDHKVGSGMNRTTRRENFRTAEDSVLYLALLRSRRELEAVTTSPG